MVSMKQHYFSILWIIIWISNKCNGFFISSPFKKFKTISRSILADNTLDTSIASVIMEIPPIITTTPKVPASAWKWPKSWPFPVDFLELVDVNTGNQTLLSEPVIEIFQQHIQNNLFNNAKVLEIGDIKNKPFLSEKLLSNSKLNLEVNSFELKYLQSQESLLPFPPNLFDRIVISSGIESLGDPRSLFRDVYRVLKPGGKCITCFSGRIYSPYEKSAKMWMTMNDEQKIWIAGSYYHYSAGLGWIGIEGYDLLGNTGEKNMVFDATVVDSSAYVVSANKIDIPDMNSMDFSAYNYTKATLLGVPYLDNDDKEFVSLRIATEFTNAFKMVDKQAVLDNVSKLSCIYDILRKVKEVVIPTPVKAMLAVFLLPKWLDTPLQRQALQLGLGLQKDTGEYWMSLGNSTSAMPPREKILFLSEIIPEFGENKYVEKLPELLSKLLIIIRRKLPEIEEAHLQIFVCDIVVTDFLLSNNEIAYERVVKFIEKSSSDEINNLIIDRMKNTLK